MSILPVRLAMSTGLLLITLYRNSLRHMFLRTCNFLPTCSCYAEESLKKYGPVKGAWLAIKRLFRCLPWRPFSIDPVP